MKNIFKSALVIGIFLNLHITAQDIEEVIITSSFIDQNLSEISNPLHVVSGEEIKTSASESLGESIDDLLGISSKDYGSAVGQPIIRGMSGARVKILENGMVNRDVSGLGADHLNDLDLSNVRQIEIVRGPSSLLYANGSIGGIINVVDNSISKRDFEESKLLVGSESQSVNEGQSQNISFEDNLGGINLTLSYKNSDFGNFDIPDGAIIHDEEEHEEHGDEEHEEHEENLTFLENSDYESDAASIGISKVGDWGYFGISYKNAETVYGIPYHGEEHEEHEEEEHEDERVFSSTDSEKLDIRGSFNMNSGVFSKVDYYFRDSDYSLTEQHAESDEAHEEEHDEDEHGHEEEGPTLFVNDAFESGLTFDLISGDTYDHKIVLNLVDEDTSIIGSEAFMNPASSDELTLGYFITRDFNLFHVDLGLRWDKIDTKGSISNREDHDEDHHEGDEEEETTFYDKSTNNYSFAINIGRDLNEFLSFDFGLARVKRAPSVVELFMNGPHLSTGRYEVGNTDLSSEESTNFDLSLNYINDGFYGELTLFRNDVDNYIYLMDETEEEHEEHEEEGHDDHGGLILANYLQQNAELEGYEFQIGRTIELDTGLLNLSFGRDGVEGTFNDGTNIPRLNPARNIYRLTYEQDDINFKLLLKDVKKQNDIGVGETSTAGYQMLDFKLTKTFDLQYWSLSKDVKSKFQVSLFGRNLLDEVARNHSSFVKSQVPLPGRNYGIKFNLVF